ncbi:hypothetical protein H0H93_003263 [Arthromyces matolae]|nr:hypothetical protein H0H93_003263 [Arthromyces matolae]
MGVPYGLSAPIATSLIDGGPATILWGWLVVSIFSLPLALSLAEICSVYPTSAGAYYWTYRLAPPKHRLLISWINGWSYTVGVWTISLSVLFSLAQLIVSEVSVFHPEWRASPWQTYLVFVGVSAFTSTFIVFFNKLLPLIDVLCALWTFLGIIVVLIGLSVKAASGRRSASFALTEFDASSAGWTPGWAFFLGMLPVRMNDFLQGMASCSWLVILPFQPAYTYSGIGMSTITSMAEEVRHPATQVPQAMVYSVPIGAIFGLAFILPIVFTLPDIPTLLNVPGGQPLGVMFSLIMGSREAGFGMSFTPSNANSSPPVFGVGVFAAISISCAASRATWSFARDKAIPFHHIFARISGDQSKASAIPFNAHLLSTAIQLLLGLIFLGSSAAFNAFVGVAVICLGATYAMPIALLIFHGNGRKAMEGAPFSLGKWGYMINIVSLLWVLFEVVLFSMPAAIPVTKVTMSMFYLLVVVQGIDMELTDYASAVLVTRLGRSTLVSFKN